MTPTAARAGDLAVTFSRRPGGRRVYLAPGAPPELGAVVEAVLESDSALSAHDPIGLPGVQTLLVLIELPQVVGPPRRYALKRYAAPLVFAFRSLLRTSRARREHESLTVLTGFSPAAVRPAAWAERRILGVCFRSVLVTELLEDAIDLKTWRLAWNRGERPAGEREKLAAGLPELARLVRRLHDAGFFAANAFHKNILWRPLEPAARAFSFVDLPFARKSRWPLGWRRRLYDLACLDKDSPMALRASERLRFYLAYLGRDALEPADKARLRKLARLRAQREHATFLSATSRGVKKWFKRTSLGHFLTGRDPELRFRG
jgi:hypothetical protein